MILAGECWPRGFSGWARSVGVPGGGVEWLARFGGLRSLTVHSVRRSLTSVRTVMSSKGQVVLPAEIRQLDRIVPGQKFELERLEAGQYLLKRLAEPDNEGVVQWLLDCPEKDWFVSVDSESTDTL